MEKQVQEQNIRFRDIYLYMLKIAGWIYFVSLLFILFYPADIDFLKGIGYIAFTVSLIVAIIGGYVYVKKQIKIKGLESWYMNKVSIVLFFAVVVYYLTLNFGGKLLLYLLTSFL